MKKINKFLSAVLSAVVALQLMGCSDLFGDKDSYPVFEPETVVENMDVAATVRILDEKIAKAVIDENGNLVITPIRAGKTEAVITYSDGSIEYREIEIDEYGKISSNAIIKGLTTIVKPSKMDMKSFTTAKSSDASIVEVEVLEDGTAKIIGHGEGIAAIEFAEATNVEPVANIRGAESEESTKTAVIYAKVKATVVETEQEDGAIFKVTTCKPIALGVEKLTSANLGLETISADKIDYDQELVEVAVYDEKVMLISAKDAASSVVTVNKDTDSFTVVDVTATENGAISTVCNNYKPVILDVKELGFDNIDAIAAFTVEPEGKATVEKTADGKVRIIGEVEGTTKIGVTDKDGNTSYFYIKSKTSSDTPAVHSVNVFGKVKLSKEFLKSELGIDEITEEAVVNNSEDYLDVAISNGDVIVLRKAEGDNKNIVITKADGTKQFIFVDIDGDTSVVKARMISYLPVQVKVEDFADISDARLYHFEPITKLEQDTMKAAYGSTIEINDDNTVAVFTCGSDVDPTFPNGNPYYSFKNGPYGDYYVMLTPSTNKDDIVYTETGYENIQKTEVPLTTSITFSCKSYGVNLSSYATKIEPYPLGGSIGYYGTNGNFRLSGGYIYCIPKAFGYVSNTYIFDGVDCGVTARNISETSFEFTATIRKKISKTFAELGVTSSDTAPTNNYVKITKTSTGFDFEAYSNTCTNKEIAIGSKKFNLTVTGETKTPSLYSSSMSTSYVTAKVNVYTPSITIKETSTSSAIGNYNSSSFTSSRFDKVKDVQWDTGSNPSTVRGPKNCYKDGTGVTPDSYWVSGSYVTLTKNSTTTSGTYLGYSGTQKTIPTYKVTLYIGGSSTNTVVLTTDLTIIGIGKYGMMTRTKGGYGTFFYTNAGWQASSNGTSSLSVTYDILYPTESEIANAIKNY